MCHDMGLLSYFGHLDSIGWRFMKPSLCVHKYAFEVASHQSPKCNNLRLSTWYLHLYWHESSSLRSLLTSQGWRLDRKLIRLIGVFVGTLVAWNSNLQWCNCVSYLHHTWPGMPPFMHTSFLFVCSMIEDDKAVNWGKLEATWDGAIWTKAG